MEDSTTRARSYHDAHVGTALGLFRRSEASHGNLKPECFVLSLRACNMSRGYLEASSMVMRRLALFLLFAAVLSNVLVRAQQADADDESQFRFRFVGPRVGNRVAAIAGIPGDPSTYYAGAASGGIWKSTDGGNRWVPVFDKRPPPQSGLSPSHLPIPVRSGREPGKPG